MVSTSCPHCHIWLIEANSNSFSDLFAAIQEGITLGAKVVSDSWGSGEQSGVVAEDQTLDTPGVAITFSSGDGAFQGGVQYPSSSNYVTSVGGTELTPDSSTARGWDESTWVNTSSSPPTQGSGSGCSAYEGKPAWQVDPGCSDRTTADVSMVAANVLGYDSYQAGGWYYEIRDQRVLTADRRGLRLGRQSGLHRGAGGGGLYGVFFGSLRHRHRIDRYVRANLSVHGRRRIRRSDRNGHTAWHRGLHGAVSGGTHGVVRDDFGTNVGSDHLDRRDELWPFPPPGSPEWDCGGSYTGDVFGDVGLNFGDQTAAWTAGQGGDCLGVIIDSWSTSNITLSLGSFYPDVTSMQTGDAYSFELQGYTFEGSLG